MSDNDMANVDDVLGFNLGPEESTSTEPLKPARISRPRNLKDHHLTSVRGLPYVRSSAQKRLKHKMNHRDEYKNLTNFLAYYQIWGHNLFPKAKFPDFLEMCATTGSERSVKHMRTQYMDEETGKQRRLEMAENFVPLVDEETGPSITPLDSGDAESQAHSITREEEERLHQQDFEDQMFEHAAEARSLVGMNEDSTLDTSPSSTTQPTTTPIATQPQPVSQPQPEPDSPETHTSWFDIDDFGDDDDDFFKELGSTDKAPATAAKPTIQTATEPDPSIEEFDEQTFHDEYEAEMEYMREQGL